MVPASERGHARSLRSVLARSEDLLNSSKGGGQARVTQLAVESWGNSLEVATGQFAGMTGSGADTGLTAGAAVKATYKGTLED